MNIPSINAEVKALRKDVNEIKQETSSFRHETDQKFERVITELVRLRRDSDDLQEMKGIVIDIRNIVQLQSNRMDQYAKDAKFVFQNDKIHDGRLKDHEKRISALESA